MAAPGLPPSSPHLLSPPSPSPFFALGGSHKSFASLDFTTRPWNKSSTKRRVGTVFAASGDYQQGNQNRLSEMSSPVQHCQVLSDDKKRALYDQYGEAGVKSTMSGGSSTYTTNPFDLFETFFGSSNPFPDMDTLFETRRCSTVTKGEDIRYDISLEFSEAIFGVEKEFEVSHTETCEVCTGSGAKVGSKRRICSTCGGRGQVMRTEQTPFGLFSQVSASGLWWRW